MIFAVVAWLKNSIAYGVHALGRHNPLIRAVGKWVMFSCRVV